MAEKKRGSKGHNKPQMSQIHSLRNNRREVWLQNSREAIQLLSRAGGLSRPSAVTALMNGGHMRGGLNLSVAAEAAVQKP